LLLGLSVRLFVRPASHCECNSWCRWSNNFHIW